MADSCFSQHASEKLGPSGPLRRERRIGGVVVRALCVADEIDDCRWRGALTCGGWASRDTTEDNNSDEKPAANHLGATIQEYSRSLLARTLARHNPETPHPDRPMNRRRDNDESATIAPESESARAGMSGIEGSMEGLGAARHTDLKL